METLSYITDGVDCEMLAREEREVEYKIGIGL